MDLGVSGLASGFDWRSLVDQLVEVERTPEKRMLAEQNSIQQRNNAFGSLKTELSLLANRLNTLKSFDFFGSRSTQSSNPGVATATSAGGAPLGQYALTVTQLASGSVQTGAANIGLSLSASDDVSGVVLNQAGFATAITNGVFTINGKQVQVSGEDSLQQVFDKIAAATQNTVSAAYDAQTDKITLSSAGEIVLGSGTDTSNFLQAARLSNNGSGAVTSAGALGGIRAGAALTAANFASPVSDGGAGAGEFKINGVSITFNASSDSLARVLERINNSAAGVTATYDARNDRVLLTSKVTGDLGIALADVSGNFLAASGLAAGTLTRGNDLLYSVNGGETLSSHSNTITESSSGITGLSITVLDKGQSVISVHSDTAALKKAIQDFLDQYNKVQGLIETQTASTTDATGKVTAGVLAQDSSADEIAARLRSLAFNPRGGLAESLRGLSQLGFATNGSNHNLSLEDEDKLNSALTSNLAAVQALFADPANGVAVQLSDYLEKTIGAEGTLVRKQTDLTRQSGAIDTQISDLERLIADRRQQMITSFLGMEEAQAKVNQQLAFLQQRFGSTSNSKN